MKVLLLGDSLFQFYDWQQRFPRIEMRNRGVMGETVKGLCERLDMEFARCPDADVVLVMIGANNICTEDYAFLRDYHGLLAMIREKNRTSRLGVVSLPPFKLPWLAQEALRRINGMLLQAAQEWRADFLDIYEPFVAAEKAGRHCILEDGVHLTDGGYRVWGDIIEHYLFHPADEGGE